MSGDDRFWFTMRAAQLTDPLVCLYQAILKWESVTGEELDEQISCFTRQPGDLPEGLVERLNYKAFTLFDLKRAMYANLAVSVATAVEAFLAEMCREHGLALPARPSLGDRRAAVEAWLAVRLDTFDGCETWTKSRILANCFKHNQGKANEDYIKEYGGERGQAIEYENEEWQALIYNTKRFLTKIASAS